MGRAGFARVGSRLVRILVDVAGLEPHERVLDVGCGPGRVARLLTSHLSPSGSYEGFDVVSEAIEWCQRTISPRFPNFRFMHVDIRNEMYNPQGVLEPSEFVFPFPDDEFDLAFLYSVFTHMLPGDVERYLRQIARVLRPGGRCLVTYFLLTDASEAAMRERRADRSFPQPGPGYRSVGAMVHERAVAYAEEDARRAIARADLRVREPILCGTWADGTGPLYQDIVVALKPDRTV